MFSLNVSPLSFNADRGLFLFSFIVGPEVTGERLLEIQEKYEIIGNISGLGLNIGIDLILDPVSKERAVEEAGSVMYEWMENGVALKTIEGDILTWRPALTISANGGLTTIKARRVNLSFLLCGCISVIA